MSNPKKNPKKPLQAWKGINSVDKPGWHYLFLGNPRTGQLVKLEIPKRYAFDKRGLAFPDHVKNTKVMGVKYSMHKESNHWDALIAKKKLDRLFSAGFIIIPPDQLQIVTSADAKKFKPPHGKFDQAQKRKRGNRGEGDGGDDENTLYIFVKGEGDGENEGDEDGNGDGDGNGGTGLKFKEVPKASDIGARSQSAPPRPSSSERVDIPKADNKPTNGQKSEESSSKAEAPQKSEAPAKEKPQEPKKPESTNKGNQSDEKKPQDKPNEDQGNDKANKQDQSDGDKVEVPESTKKEYEQHAQNTPEDNTPFSSKGEGINEDEDSFEDDGVQEDPEAVKEAARIAAEQERIAREKAKAASAGNADHETPKPEDQEKKIQQKLPRAPRKHRGNRRRLGKRVVEVDRFAKGNSGDGSRVKGIYSYSEVVFSAQVYNAAKKSAEILSNFIGKSQAMLEYGIRSDIPDLLIRLEGGDNPIPALEIPQQRPKMKIMISPDCSPSTQPWNGLACAWAIMLAKNPDLDVLYCVNSNGEPVKISSEKYLTLILKVL
jgi:hypothetical protein